MKSIGIGVLLLVTMASLSLSLAAGSEWLSIIELWQGVVGLLGFGDNSSSHECMLLWWRIPRVINAFLCGGILAIAGCLYQRVFQNPLVAPDILGTSAGAALGSVMSLSMGGGLAMTACGSAIGGGCAAGLALLVSYVLARRGVMNILVLILCGILLSSFLASVMGVWRYLTPDNGSLRGIYYILAGGFGSAGWSELQLLAIVAAIGILPVIFLRPFLSLLALPLDVLQTQGINIRFWSCATLFLGALLAAVTVIVAGVVGWVALVVPNIVHYISKSGKPQLVATGLVGGCFLMLADMFGRSFTSAEIPAGIITGIAGIPFVLIILYLELRK